jgi:hypothetical protein
MNSEIKRQNPEQNYFTAENAEDAEINSEFKPLNPEQIGCN